MIDTLETGKPLDPDLLRAVKILAEVFESKAVKYALIGGLATSLRGRPRFTQDADFILEVPQLALPGLLETLAERGFEFDMATVIRQFVRESITVLRFGTIRIDWLKPILPLYARVVDTASEVPWSAGRSVRVASAEGIIITKMVAYRKRDVEDIESLLIANRDTIDIEKIRSEWAPFAAKDAGCTAWLEETIKLRVIDRQ